MAKKIYVGVNNIARNVSKMYVGVNGVARKIKKGYVGVNGVARLFLKALVSGFRFYSSSVVSLSYQIGWLDDYCHFGDKDWYIYTNSSYPATYICDIFNSALTRTNRMYALPNIGSTINTIEGINNDDYVYIRCSDTASPSSYTDNNVVLVDSNETQVNALSLYNHIYGSHARVGDKIVFVGGDAGSGPFSKVEYFDGTVKSDATSLSQTSYMGSGTSFRDKSYAVFAGGGLSRINFYDSTMTRILSQYSGHPYRGCCGSPLGDDYVLFGGGAIDTVGSSQQSQVIVCNKSGTTTQLTQLSSGSWRLRANDYENKTVIPLFESTVVNVYDDTLTKSSNLTTSGSGKGFKQVGQIGKYLSIPYGWSNTTIDLFTPIY